MQSSGFAKPLVAVVVVLMLVMMLGSMALPVLAREQSGLPFFEVDPEIVEPDGPPDDLAFTPPDPTIPEDDTAVDEEPAEDDPDADLEDPDAVEDEPADTEPPANDLSDIPAYPVPAGFDILDRWNDGDNHVRSTVWAAPDGDPGALPTYLAADRGGWTGVDISETVGVDTSRQWLFERDDHPYCLWIEFYVKGVERVEEEAATGLDGPQFLVVETPYCEGLPDPYA
jgi:hypothetical protein